MSKCNDCDCVQVDPFRVITKSFEGLENEGTETVVDNQERTIEVKMKPQQYASRFAFPNRGDPAIIYVDIGANASYRWDAETEKYVCIGTDYRQIKIINGGNANGN